MPTYADAASHNALPDEFLWCITTRRHHFPPPASEQKVRIAYDGGTLDLFEAVTKCLQCGTERTLWRDQQTERFVHGTYAYPDGYVAPPGTTWDRDYLRQVWRKRHPVSGHTRVIAR